jgi:acetyltransferase-like isoleucine patch superfamily enzyme
VKALQEIGVARAARFVWISVLLVLFRLAFLPPLRSLFLRLCGARVGGDSVIHGFTMINVDRGGFRALQIGANCFIGDEVLIDLAAPVVLEDHVTLATRAVVLTHLNVGYKDHPLQARFPSQTAGVTIRHGSFIGAGAMVLAGSQVGPEAFVAAASLVNRTVGEGEVVGGVPIKTLHISDAPPRIAEPRVGAAAADLR